MNDREAATDRFRCRRHDFWIAENTPYCPQCLADATGGPDPAGMSAEERAAEVRRWLDEPMTIPLEPLWARIDALVGRSVLNIELGLRGDELIEEARARSAETPHQAITDSVAATGKLVIVLIDDEADA